MGNLECEPTLDDRYVYSGRVTRVIDGDTVVIDIDLGCDVWMRNAHCRLAGINAPEIRGEQAYDGVRAKEFLDFIVHTTKPVVIRTHKDRREKYGRWLVELWQDGVSLNQRMLENGHATVIEVD
jgi:micrococcal nuclease